MEPILKYYKNKFLPWDGADHSPWSIGVFVQPANFPCGWPVLRSQTYRGVLTEIMIRDAKARIVVERITLPLGMSVPAHRHPNVSTLDFGIWGSGRFSVGNHQFAYDDVKRARLPLYVRRGVPHYGEVGDDKDATIISFQYWYEWPPKESILLDWEGA